MRPHAVTKRRFRPSDLAQLATRIPRTLHRAALLQAIAEERPLTAFVTEALTEHLARCQGTQGPRAIRAVDRNAPRSRGSGDARVTTGEE
jgi:hypothetical protein